MRPTAPSSIEWPDRRVRTPILTGSGGLLEVGVVDYRCLSFASLCFYFLAPLNVSMLVFSCLATLITGRGGGATGGVLRFAPIANNDVE